MDYAIRFRIKVTNPSWDKALIGLAVKYVIPLIPFILLVYYGYKAVYKTVHDGIESVLTFIVALILIPIGLISLAVLFGIPVVLFCAAMGWIK